MESFKNHKFVSLTLFHNKSTSILIHPLDSDSTNTITLWNKTLVYIFLWFLRFFQIFSLYEIYALMIVKYIKCFIDLLLCYFFFFPIFMFCIS